MLKSKSQRLMFNTETIGVAETEKTVIVVYNFFFTRTECWVITVTNETYYLFLNTYFCRFFAIQLPSCNSIFGY